LNTHNDIFSLYLIEKPVNNRIYFDEHFKIILQIASKTSKNLKLKINTERSSDKDLEILDIVEKVNKYIYY
jgi:hypothetical protein